jgi:hypothetical protein
MISARHAHRWTRCAASAAEPLERFPDEPSDLSLECDAAQWVARSVLRRDCSAAEELVSRVTPRGWTITVDLAYHAQIFVDQVAAMSRRGGAFWVLQDGRALEEWGPIEQVDGFAALDENRRLHVYAFDYGWQRAELDDDLMSALAAIVIVDNAPGPDPAQGFVQHIYQPRPYHPDGPLRERQRTADELVNMRNWLGHCAAAARDDKAKTQAGRQCRGCDHSARCETLNRYLYAELQVTGGRRGGRRAAATDLSRQITHAELFATLAEEHLKALKLEGRARVLAGEWIPGWRVGTGLGHRELAEAPSLVAMVTGVPATKTVTRSPAEMERDGADPALLAQFTTRPRTGPRLERATAAEAKKVFKI